MRPRGEDPKERLRRAVGTIVDGAPLTIIESDLSDPGVDASPMLRLADRTETVIHCAGDTSFFPKNIDDARAVFIGGPLALLARLHAAGLRRWLQVSTAYVCGERSGTVFEHERYVGQSFHNPYEQLKLAAEIALERQCGEINVDLLVVRPSIVVGPPGATQGRSPSNLFFEFIRIMAAVAKRQRSCAVPLQIPGSPRSSFNIVPLDYVSAAITTLIDHPGATGGTFHLVLPDPPTQEIVLHRIASRFGLGAVSLYKCDTPGDAPPVRSLIESRIAQLLAPYQPYLQQDVRFADTQARKLLQDLRPPSADAMLDAFVDSALGQERFAASCRLVASPLS